VLVDNEGRIVRRQYREVPLYYPHAGWVEQDAEEVWRATQEVCAAVVEGIAGDIGAVGITNQRETVVVWDRATGRPVHRAIVWQCRRTARECQALRDAGHAEEIADKTGLVLDPYFSATKLAWILQRLDGDADRLAAGTIDTWLIWHLTGGRSHATDMTNASRTMLLDIRARRWDDDLLGLFGVPKRVLPEVCPSSARFGRTLGVGFLPDGIPICGVAGDQQAALYGQTCFDPGGTKNTYGTGCFLLMNTGADRPRSRHGLLTTLACGANGEPVYALEGSVFVTGAAVQWLRDGLGIIASAGESEAAAASVPDAGGVVFVPALTGLGAPHWNADVRGALFGLTRGTTRAHIVRAALEGIAHQTADVVEAMVKDSGIPLSALRVDGGGAANTFLLQFQADLLGAVVERAAQTETTVLGACYLAGFSIGDWTPNDLRTMFRTDARFAPAMDETARRRHRAAWQKAVARLLNDP
jgi:glycerol kinase